MIKPRDLHSVLDFEIDRLDDGAVLTVRTDDEADHTFLFDRQLAARLFGEIGRLRDASPAPKGHQK